MISGGLPLRRVCALCATALALTALNERLAVADFCPQASGVLSTTDAASGDAPITVCACHLNGDGYADLVTANDASDTVSLLLNNGDGTYAAKVRWPIDDDDLVVSEPLDVACCDLNGDTLIDLVTANHTSDDVSVLLNDGTGQFPTAVKYAVGEAPFNVECVDLDGINGNDLVVNALTADAVSVLLNNGDGTFAPHVSYPVGNGPIAMAICDVDGDTDADVVTANFGSQDVSVLRNESDGTFVSLGTADICTSPTDCIIPFDITCCDLDGVNGPDVATANSIDDSVAVLYNDGSGSFGGIGVYAGADGAYALTCCDIDGDSDAEIVSANLTSDDLVLFENDGAGVLVASVTIPVGTDSSADPSSVLCIDLGDDSDADLATTFSDGIGLFENDCVSGTCGDGSTDPGETCDDGFTDACGTCNATCTGPGSGSICGDGVVCPETEACDDGFADDCGSCDATCTGAGTGSTCGDGTVCPETEECDDENNDPGDGCSATCDNEGGDPIPPGPLAETGEAAKTNRYLRFLAPPSGGGEEVIRVRIVDLDGFPLPVTDTLYLGSPFEAPEEVISQPTLTFTVAPLQCAPNAHNWTGEGIISAYGAEIMPGSAYEVQRAAGTCADLESDERCWSTPLEITTAKYGDVAPLYDGDSPDAPQPDFNDVAAIVQKFLGAVDAPIKSVAQLQPNVVYPNRPIDFKDIATDVEAFLDVGYAESNHGPCACPAAVPCHVTPCTTDSVCDGGLCVGGFCADACGRCAP